MLIMYVANIVQMNWYKIEFVFSIAGAIVFLIISSVAIGHHDDLVAFAIVSRQSEF